LRKILKKTCNIDNERCDRPESSRTNIFSRCLLKSKFLLEKTSFLGLSPSKNCLPQTLLKNIQGTFLPGRLVAILGPSGSGKSTLLNILAGRLPQTEGHLKINGQIMSSRDLKKISAFIQQVDLFLPNITVEEHLRFQVKLRLDKSISAAKRTVLVQEVMTKFGLFKIRDNLIGSSDLSYGISTGERKRLSVATATITNPLILLADEPTTGLDSVMAKSVINSLRYIAATGRTVIASLHQPNTQTFAMFDEVILLAGGRIIYFGDRLGSVEWMKRLGLFCSNHANPSDFLIKCVSLPENPEKQLQKQQQLQHWAQMWEKEGNNFLRQWTEGGRLAFFLSSCSLAKESIELGITSMASHMSRPFSNESSKWSINDEILTHRDVLEASSHAYVQDTDAQNPKTYDTPNNPSKISETAHNLHVSDIFQPSHLAKQSDFIEIHSSIKRDASDIYGIKNHFKVYFEEPIVDTFCMSANVKKGNEKKASKNTCIAKVQHTTMCLHYKRIYKPSSIHFFFFWF
jgi:ABC-type multidrug transport system ATPase subunit